MGGDTALLGTSAVQHAFVFSQAGKRGRRLFWPSSHLEKLTPVLHNIGVDPTGGISLSLDGARGSGN
jgi:hypothetical protein